MAHGRAQEYQASLAGNRDGTITGYQLHVVQDSGAYPIIGAVLPMLTRMMASGVYDIPKVGLLVDLGGHQHLPRRGLSGAPVGPRPPTPSSGMIDLFAIEIGHGPGRGPAPELPGPRGLPLTTPVTGAEMDTGEYAKALDAVIEAADYAALRADQEARRNDPSRPCSGSAGRPTSRSPTR